MNAAIGSGRRALGSLKIRLALASVVLILASVGLTVYFVLREVGRATERIVLDSLEDDAQRVAAILSGRLVGLQLALRSAATQFPIETPNDAEKVSEFLSAKPVLSTLFSSVFVATLDGRMLAIDDEHGIRDPHVNIADRGYFKDTLKYKRTLISPPTLSRVNGEPIIIFTFPVSDRNGHVVAVLGASLRLSTRSLLGDLTQANSGRESPILTIVTDSTGQIISHPSKEWLLRRGETEPNLTAAMAAWEAQGRPVEPAGYSIRAGSHEVGLAGVPDADWMVFRTAPAEALLGGILQGEKRARWLGLSVALGGGALILLIMFILLRPLRQLQSRALRLLTDDVDVQGGWPRMSGELGELSKVFQHVIQQRQASQSSGQLLLAKMRAVMAKAPVGIAFTRDRRFELVSAEFNRLFGYEGAGLEGEPARLIYITDQFYQELGTRISAAFTADKVFGEEAEFVRRDGTRFWGQMHGARVSDDPSAGTIWTLEDVTQTRQRREALSWAATHDGLTQLANRQEFELRLSEQMRTSRQGDTASALFIDLDQFKTVNDRAGHAAGDQMLKNIAAILLDRARSGDCVARLGGDEFAVLLRGCGREAAVIVAEQMRAMVEGHVLEWQGQRLQAGVSIGVVEIDAGMADTAAVLAAADAACYAAKRAGRNAVRTHETPLLRVV